MRSLWRNPSWLRVIAWLLLIAYIELKPPDGEAGWLLIAFMVLEVRALVVAERPR